MHRALHACTRAWLTCIHPPYSARRVADGRPEAHCGWPRCASKGLTEPWVGIRAGDVPPTHRTSDCAVDLAARSVTGTAAQLRTEVTPRRGARGEGPSPRSCQLGCVCSMAQAPASRKPRIATAQTSARTTTSNRARSHGAGRTKPITTLTTAPPAIAISMGR
jgi:hypothetical protein